MTRAFCTTLLLAAALPAAAAQPAEPSTTTVRGAASSRVIMVGGGDYPESVIKRCLEGTGGRVLVVPTASSEPTTPGEVAEEFKKAGAKSTVVADKDPKKAAGQLKKADVVWFTGGDQNRVTKAFLGTPFFDALQERLRQGIVVAGTSAGAAIGGELMITGEGDFETIDPKAVETAPGMSFLRGVLIDQHFLRRQRLNRLISVLLAHPDLVGVGVDEKAAAEFQGDRMTVLTGRVVVLRPGTEGLLLKVHGEGESLALK